MINRELDKKLQSGYALNLGSLIEKSFEPFKKTFLISAVGFIILGLVILSLYAALLGMLFGFSDIMGTFTDLAVHATDTNVLIGTAIFSTVVSAIVAPVTAGFINVNHIVKRGESMSLGNIFEFYGNKYTKDIIVCYAIIGLLNGVLTAGFTVLGFSWIASVFQGILACATIFSIPLIIYNDQKFGDAISKSITLFSKQPFTIIIAVIIAYLIAILGFIGLCIGVIFTMPYIYSMYYTIYDEAIGFEKPFSAIDEIGTIEE